MSPLFNFFRRNKSPENNEVDQEIKDIIGSGHKVKNNPNFDTFSQVEQVINNVVNNRSIFNELPEMFTQLPACYSAIDELQALPIETNKAQRIKQYRIMSALPECDWCIEEIADDFIHEDDSGEFIKLVISNDKINNIRRSFLNNEFRKFIAHFNLKDNGFNLMKRFVIEGELAWENIINPDHTDLGIIGVKFIPCEYYETLINVDNGERIGLFIDSKQYHEDIKRLVSQSYYNSRQIFNNILGTSSIHFNRDHCIPMLWPQVTYVNSDDISPDGMICFPLVEKAKQAYYQYVLMKDAAVILRVTRAPERLLFNINTGNMNPKMADDYIRKFGNQLRNKKVVSSDPNVVGKQNITNVYNPTTMLESWIFSKSNANDGTTVDTIGSTAQYDQIEDMKFFQRALLKQFKVPWSRYEAPDALNEQIDSISYEEYTFSRMLIRLQRRFAIAFKNSFIVHLKLRGMLERYDISDSDLDVEFTPPVLYDITKRQKLLEAKIGAYAVLADREEFSKQLAMKNVLGMSDDEIRENFEKLTQEKIWLAGSEFYSGKVDDENSVMDVVEMARKGKTTNPNADSSEEDSGSEEDDMSDDSGVIPAEEPEEELDENPDEEISEEPDDIGGVIPAN
jgi:hypothetical protein